MALIKELKEFERNQIVILKKSGLSGRNIASKLNLNQSTVNRIIKWYAITSSIKNKQRSGRPKKISEDDHKNLLNIIEKNRRITLQDIAKEITSKPSKSTICQALHDANFHSRIAAKKPFICARNQEKRLAFVLECQNFTIEDWKHIVWTDESIFEIGRNTRQIHVWRNPSECFNTACLTPSFKSGRKSMMIWGSFMWGKCGPLVILPEGHFNGRKYIDILEKHFLDFWMEQSEKKGYIVFQEDNSPIHTCKLAKQ